MSNNIKNKALKRRILDISYAKKLSHIGSCLTAVDIIDDIFSAKKPDDIFLLSAGHSGLALYCILEKYEHKDAEKIFDEHGVHPDRCTDCGITYSSGSLGHGIGAAVGFALADRTRDVYCLISDGELMEGSCYEALRIAHEQKLTNLHIYVNANGFGAYGEIDSKQLEKQVKSFGFSVIFCYTSMDGFPDYPEYLQGQQAHYVTLNKEQYDEVRNLLK